MNDQLAERRDRMMRAIERDARETATLTGRAVLSESVIAAMRAVSRHEFVLPGDEPYAYDNAPLPIGHGQTISQPFVVALMTDLLDLPAEAKETARVLEVGTGCGYQAAVLAALAKEVYSIEIVEPLAHDAAERLARLGYQSVKVKAGDGYAGWAEHAPFDGILVTAAAPYIPPPLVEQLKPGAQLVIPVGMAGRNQELLVVHKGRDGTIEQKDVLPVAFVPLTGEREPREPE